MKLLFSFAVAILLLLFSTGAIAQGLSDPCGEIFDGTNSVAQGTVSRIRADIEALRREVEGVDLHVHIGQTLNLDGRQYQGIDDYSDALDRKCGWEVDGGVANGTLVYIVITLSAPVLSRLFNALRKVQRHSQDLGKTDEWDHF